MYKIVDFPGPKDLLLSHSIVSAKNAPFYAYRVSRFAAFSNKNQDFGPDLSVPGAFFLRGYGVGQISVRSAFLDLHDRWLGRAANYCSKRDSEFSLARFSLLDKFDWYAKYKHGNIYPKTWGI